MGAEPDDVHCGLDLLQDFHRFHLWAYQSSLFVMRLTYLPGFGVAGGCVDGDGVAGPRYLDGRRWPWSRALCIILTGGLSVGAVGALNG